jgi:hypothetical protein
MTEDYLIIGSGRQKNPKKIKIFMWLVEQKSILIKDNLIRRK